MTALLTRTTMDLIDAVTAAGLRGRGGGGFPTGRKLRTAAAGRGRPVVIVNACEGEPISDKDHVLLATVPHEVLDGAVLAARAIGASEVVVCRHEGEPLPAVDQRRDDVPVRLLPVPRTYIASEESALVNLVRTGDARPTTARPYETRSFVSNAETFLHIARIARHGPDAFRAHGTAESPGTMFVTTGGAVATRGVREVPCGTPIGDLLDRPAPTAVLVGGLAGAWLPLPSALSLPFSHEGLAPHGASPGPGALWVLPPGACGLAETARILQFLAGQSARQCGPCMFGLPAIADDVTRIAHGGVAPRLDARLGMVAGRGACRHPDGAVRLARSALRVFATDLERHHAGVPCPQTAYVPLSRKRS